MFAIVTERENFPTSKIAVDIAKPKVPFKPLPWSILER
jgi:hypothetical protein